MPLNTTGGRRVRTGGWRTPRRRRRALLAGAVLLALVAQVPVWEWVVDDAAISFAYAKNLAHGEGLVAQPGGERVEGYSNPTWVVLLAAWEKMGVGGFTAAKLMGAIFGALCVPLAWCIARWSRPDRDEVVPLLAAFVLAANVTFAIWNTSGLENSLFGLLLAAATWCTLLETRQRGFPVSALLFLGLAVTRPEGILYAAVGGFAAMAFSLRDGRGFGPTLRWLAVFFVPFGAYHGLRLLYFAWPFPNTYYAKLAYAAASPFDWNGRGWSYVRDYAGLSFADGSPGPGLGTGYLLPVLLFGALGTAGRRGRIALGLSVAAGLLLLLPPPPEWIGWIAPAAAARGGASLPSGASQAWLLARVVGLVALAVGVPFAAAGRRGGRALALCWALAATSLAFAVRARGDWMHGYRWLSLLAVPGSVLFAAGLGELRDWVRQRSPRLGRGAAAAQVAAVGLPLLLWMLPQLRHLAWFVRHAPTSVTSVELRVDYEHALMDTLRLERATILDVDLGAHLYRSRARLVDLVGLVDVPFAHHHFDAGFLREYLFRERRPDFAHIHGDWAKRTGILDLPEWSRDYLRLPGYLARNGKVHTGDFIRRRLLFTRRWPGGAARRVVFRDGATLAGWQLPGLPTAPGLPLTLELGFGGPEAAERQIEVFVAGGGAVVARRDVTPAYGWLPRSAWRPGELFRGEFVVPLDAKAPPGVYDLGFVVRDPGGRVVPARPPPRGAAAYVVGGWGGVRAFVAPGEVRFPGAVRVAPLATVLERTDADRAVLAERAAGLECAAAAADWRRVRARFAGRADRLAHYEPEATGQLAECFARSALATEPGPARIDRIARAWQLDHRNRRVRDAARRIGAELFAAGEAARRRGDWDAAYRLFADAVRANPALAWARRRAEEARARRLEASEAGS